MDLILNLFLVIVLVSLFNLTRYVLKIRKILKMHRDNPNIQGISIVNGEIKVIERNDLPVSVGEAPVKELVTDPVCGKSIEKDHAYRIFKEEKEYFFCSWECREKFLKTSSTEEGEH